jgi:hypothetical protein
MRKIAFAALGLLVVSSLLYAQQKSSVQLSKDYIDVLGARLRLGMTKADVEEKIVGAKATMKHEDEWFFEGTTLQFKEDRLNFADREWSDTGKSTTDAIFDLVTLLNSEGYSTCSMSTDTHPDPTMTSHRVWLHCGKKSVLILTGRLGDKVVELVSEQLGVFEARGK